MPVFVKFFDAVSRHPVFVNPDSIRLVRAAPDAKDQETCVLVFAHDHELHVLGVCATVAEQMSGSSESADELG